MLLLTVTKSGTDVTEKIRPDGSLVIRLDELRLLAIPGKKLTVPGRLAVYPVTVRLTGVAAEYVLSPACVTVTAQVPGAVIIALRPEMLQPPVAA